MAGFEGFKGMREFMLLGAACIVIVACALLAGAAWLVWWFVQHLQWVG